MAEWGPGATEREKVLRLQQQARTDLSRRGRTSLEADADYYRSQAEDTTLPPDDRRLWLQLADETDTRLGRKAPPSEQTALF